MKSEYAYSSTRGKAQQAKGPVATPRRRAVENQSTGGFPSTETPVAFLTLEEVQEVLREIESMDYREEELAKILKGSKNIVRILAAASESGMSDWYLGGGCIAQTVWNHLHGFPPEAGIKDYDLVYYDPEDLSEEGEERRQRLTEKSLSGIEIEVVNQARVHLWYGKEFGKDILQFKSAEEAIDTWPTTATAIGVRMDEKGGFEIYSPFGLDYLFGMVARANKAKITEDVFLGKTARWKAVWPKLKIIPWDEADL